MASPDVLILRPQPGADITGRRAEAAGLSALVSPIFHVAPLPWHAPDPATFQALVVTSAHAPRQAGPQLARYLFLPCYAVGESSAASARQAGFSDVRTGPSDADALRDLMRADGIANALHLCGRHHLPLGFDERAVYTSDALPFLLPDALGALRGGAIPLLHSARSAAHFAHLVDAAGLERAAIAPAAISQAAADAAGTGWCHLAIAAAPRDQPLLECAAKLCKEWGVRKQR